MLGVFLAPGADPVAQRALVDPQIRGALRNPALRGDHQLDRVSPELGGVLLSLHVKQLLLTAVSTNHTAAPAR